MAISRRRFLQQTGLLSGGLLLHSTGFAAMNKRPIGLQLWTLRKELTGDVPDVIAKVAAAGYTDLETFGGGGDFFRMKPAAFRKLLDDQGLVSSSGHYYYPPDETFDGLIKEFITAAGILQQKYIVIPAMPAELYKTVDGLKRGAAQLNRAGRLCREANLQLAYHNHAFEFATFGSQTGYDILLAETDPTLVKMELDIYFAVQAGQDPIALFNKAPGRFALLHMKDMDKQNPDLNTEVGSGKIDFKNIFQHIRAAGVDRIFVEQEDFAMDPYQSLRKSADYVKKLL
ncbi:TIM barrel protein [Chitinophaga sp. SYP-B3965]|uniref:sugar phosphate isomerase/epimerase family protein n=1 Tax=Chitinophaga sp. SYP-B3965 TaxID=2663120 RepID=UPI001299B644|nr:sugar phosphate isomerase/epimerase [Chitinophaga sp. SYP-B3965]MRG48322.1 TIM barrel protein [Chitinophaga sp. SYP-B3965]